MDVWRKCCGPDHRGEARNGLLCKRLCRDLSLLMAPMARGRAPGAQSQGLGVAALDPLEGGDGRVPQPGKPVCRYLDLVLMPRHDLRPPHCASTNGGQRTRG